MEEVRSLIKFLTIQRVSCTFDNTNPVKFTDENNILINNSTRITILELKFDEFFNNVFLINNVKVLKLKDIYSINEFLNEEFFQKIPLRKFNIVSIISGDEDFQFFNNNELSITNYDISPISMLSKKHYLGLLFNTGELIILKKENFFENVYEIKIVVFDLIMNDLKIPYDNNNIYLNKTQYLSLKIKCFFFSQIDLDVKEILFLGLFDNNNFLRMYSINEDYYNKTDLMLNKQINKIIVTVNFSNWFKINDDIYEFSNYMSCTCSDNSLILFKLNYDHKNKLTISDSIELIKKNRFVNYKSEWIKCDLQKHILVNTSTTYIYFFLINNFNKIETYVHKLKSFRLVTGLIKKKINSNLYIIIGYENGFFESFKFDIINTTIQKSFFEKQFLLFTQKILHFYDSIEIEKKKMNKNESTNCFENINEKNAETVFFDKEFQSKKTVNNINKNHFFLHSIAMSNNGIISLLYSIIPKNILNYTISSQLEIHLAFLNFNEIFDYDFFNVKEITNSYFSDLYMIKLNDIPIFPQKENINSISIQQYILELIDFKKKYLIDENSVNLNIENDLTINNCLDAFLIKNFIKNNKINSLQNKFNFNLVTFNSLIKIQIKNEELSKFLNSLKLELSQIGNQIKSHLILLIFKFIKFNNIKVIDDFDKYLLIDFYQILKFLKIGSSIFLDIIPDICHITIKTNFFEESFLISSHDNVDFLDDFLNKNRLAKSNSNHYWPKCLLTGLPLLELLIRKDDQKRFNYIHFFKENKNTITSVLLKTINFCYLTGNKVYNLR